MKTFILTFISFLVVQFSFAQYTPYGEPIEIEGSLETNQTLPSHTSSFTSDNCIWSDIRALNEINTADADVYPWLSPDGLRLYFTQDQGNIVLLMASRTSVDSLFGNVQPLSFNMPGLDYVSCWLTNDELEIFLTTSSIGYTDFYYANRSSINSPFSTPTQMQINGISPSFYSGPSLTQDKSQLFLYKGSGTDSIYVFTQTGPLTYDFSERLPIGDTGAGQLSKDGLKYYIGVNVPTTGELYVSSRDSLAGSFTSFTPLMGTINTPLWELTPTLNGSGDIMVFATSSNNQWNGNDLYIAKGHCTPVSIEEVDKSDTELVIYPNPTTGALTIKHARQGAEQLHIYDLHGRLMLAQSLERQESEVTIDMNGMEKGMYFCQIIMASGQHKMAKIIVE